MCGILGVFTFNPAPDLAQRLGTAITALYHRGPDDRGMEVCAAAGGTLALGHTRLSIIDLSAGGHQPMHSADGRYTIIFNGEIYNYRELRQELTELGDVFRTDSDTEVLIACWAQWGAGCLSRLRGMFAFAVFDREAKTLTCARDAFGIKPLFFQFESDEFLFASETPALLKLMPRRPSLNLQRAYDYLVYGSYDDREDTFFETVRHLLPGHLLVLDLAAMAQPEICRWWWPSIQERTDLSFTDAAEKLREMFLNNIRLHLRSDVPLGAALSGGVDSSAVVCAMRHLEPDIPIHTFTFVARGSDVDEEKWANLTNQHVGAIAHKVFVSPEEMIADLDDMLLAQGEPFGSTSIYAQYRVFKLAREQGITVTLDGQGADELLAGYSGYPSSRMRSLLECGEPLRMLRFLNQWSQWPGRSVGQCLRTFVGQVLSSHSRDRLRKLWISPDPDWLNSDALRLRRVVLTIPKSRHHDEDDRGRRVVESLRQALAGEGLNALLRHGDRNAMRWSIESRVPFLTTDMAEYLLTLPEHYLISQGGQTKHVFRAAMRGLVPDVILDRKDKVGFATPEQSWLHTIGETALKWTDVAEQVPFLKPAQLREYVRLAINGQSPLSSQSWRLVNFCRWVFLANPKIN